jgi:hypothetical protein
MDPLDAAVLLGIDPTAGLDEIDRAFRAAARDAHPDVHPVGTAAHHWATARMRRLLEARALLRRAVDLREPAPSPTAATRDPGHPRTAGSGGTARPVASPHRAAALARAATATARQAPVPHPMSRPDRHGTSRPVPPRVTYRRVRAGSLTWVVVLLATAVAFLAAQPGHATDTSLTWYAGLLGVAAAAATTLATRAQRNLATTRPRP